MERKQRCRHVEAVARKQRGCGMAAVERRPWREYEDALLRMPWHGGRNKEATTRRP